MSALSMVLSAQSVVFASNNLGEVNNTVTPVSSANDLGADPAIMNGTVPVVYDGSTVNPFARIVYAETTANVNFRSKASTVAGEVYCIIPKGYKLEVVDSTSDTSWAKVRYTIAGTVKTGYVHKDYLKF